MINAVGRDIPEEILKQTGKEEIGTLATLAGLVIVLVMVLSLIGDLFGTIKTMFDFG